MLKLIRNAEIVIPETIGTRDILIAGEAIVAVADPGTIDVAGCEMEVIDASGLLVLPGLVDTHVHLTGGGGEGGPATRAPEIRVEEIVGAGVTTVIGCLGTDGVTRHPSSLLAKAQGLEAEGITARIYVGSYEVPAQNLTGSVRSDLALLPMVVGAGEIAISDHRSAQPTHDELARLAAECRVGGMLGGKPGILHLHVGDGERGLEPVRRIVRETEIPITQIIPTHCNRNPELLQQALDFAAAGGRIDLTAGIGHHPPSMTVVEAVSRAVAAGVPLERISVSSDGNGSLPVFDESGRLAGMGVASPAALLEQLRRIVGEGVLDLARAAALFSTNPATFYGLKRKGRVAAGADADLMILDSDLELVHLLARGTSAVVDGVVVLRGTFSAGA
jgi:beta-aspartyl-dipeptidase (metallo-type)